MIARGEIYFVDLDPVLGREIGGGKPRPVLVLSINDLNLKPLVVSVVPGTSNVKTERAFRNVAVFEPNSLNGLHFRTAFQCHQIRALDHLRFPPRPTGRASGAEMKRIEDAVRFSLGL
jgi:mRNA interferase MazF